MSLTPKRCLQNMADDLGRMREAQARYADLTARYPSPDVSMDDVRLAQGDTAYYAQQAQTWALAATALLAGLERYGKQAGPLQRNTDYEEWHINLPDADRDCHAAVPNPEQHEGWRIEHGEAVRVR